jgi:hypothetical protein
VGITHAAGAGLVVISTGSTSNVRSSISNSWFLLSNREQLLKIDVFRHVTSCSLVDRYQHFGRPWCFTLQSGRVDQESQSQSFNNLRSVGQSVLVSSPIWGPRADCCYSQTVVGLLMWGALSNERKGLSFTIAAGLRQHSHSRV